MRTDNKHLIKRFGSKAELPEWFNLKAYEVFATASASTWLENILIRKELFKQLDHSLNSLDISDQLLGDIENLCKNPFASRNKLSLFSNKEEGCSSTNASSHVSCPSGVSLLTREKFELYSASRAHKDMQLATLVLAADRADYPSGKVSEKSDEEVERDWEEREPFLEADGFYEQSEVWDEDLLHPDELSEMQAQEAAEIVEEFYELKRDLGYEGKGWEEPLPAATILGESAYLVTIDLKIQDSILKEQFAQTVAHLRRTSAAKTRQIEKPRIYAWVNAQVLPYLDLQLWSQSRLEWFSAGDLTSALFSGVKRLPAPSPKAKSRTSGRLRFLTDSVIKDTTKVHVDLLMNESSSVFQNLVEEAKKEAASRMSNKSPGKNSFQHFPATSSS